MREVFITLRHSLVLKLADVYGYGRGRQPAMQGWVGGCATDSPRLTSEQFENPLAECRSIAT